MTADLFHVETSLSRLHAQRDDLIAEMQVAPTVEDQVRIGNAIEAVEGLIRDEAKPNSVRKVDNFRGYILHLEMLEAAAKKEKQVQAAHEKQARDTIDFMKRIAAATMEATGKERLEGTLGHIRFQKNGGSEPPPLISQPDLVPLGLCTFSATLPYSEFMAFMRALESTPAWTVGQHERLCDAFARVPSPALIKAELDKPCGSCGGSGQEIGTAFPEVIMGQCSECGGTGRNAVPGCSSQTRGQHVRIC